MIMPIVHISGMIIPIVYISGMIPVSIMLLNSFKYNGIHKLIVDLIYSLMVIMNLHVESKMNCVIRQNRIQVICEKC
jgi:hypothetical protein